MKSSQRKQTTAFYFLRYIKPIFIIIIIIHLSANFFSFYMFIDFVRHDANRDLVAQTSVVIQHALKARKKNQLRKQIVILESSKTMPGFDLEIIDKKPAGAIILPPNGSIDIQQEKSIHHQMNRDKRIYVALYLPQLKQWLSITAKRHLDYDDETVVKFIFGVIIPISVTLFFALLYWVLAGKQVSSSLLSSLGKKNPKQKSSTAEPHEITALKEKIQQIISEQTILLRSISHDLKSPLLKLRLHLEDLKSHQKFDQLNKQVDYMDEIIQSSLTFSKLSEQNIKFKKTELTSLLHQVHDEHYASYSTIKFKIPRSLVIIRANSTLLKRAIINLVNNSLKFTKSITVTLKTKENEAIITVADEGPGMSTEEIEQATKPYKKLTNIKSGLGLGLTIVKKIVELHQATLNIKSRKKGGLSVSIHLKS